MYSTWQQYVVTFDDLAGSPQLKMRQWVHVAARVFPELGTVSKAKRARKAGNLLFNGQQRVPTLTCVAVYDILTYNCLQKQNQLSNIDDARSKSWLKICETQGLRIVYECSTFAVVVKPVGIHVKGRSKRTVEEALPMLLHRPPTVDSGDSELPTPHIVHRLDYRVGGLLLVAKTRKLEVKLSRQLEQHSVTKQYRAILVGEISVTRADDTFSIKSMEIPYALMKMQSELLFLADPIDGKPCLTAMRVVYKTRSARYEWVSTVDLWPITGRKHQLRIHTAQIGHPIIGDDLYHDAANRQEAVSFRTKNFQPPVVRGNGLFLFSIGIAFDDAVGNRRNFHIKEPNKFARFRHFCHLNWQKQEKRYELKSNLEKC
ncbi:pseudouridine synthase [Plasmopara halstedii]|uniref:Pseudouridine synthase n=1 Tax=Plasmopara halstedii TaxID=4781 RepID=A0A0P1AX32_PLAHL|nr:pseudouridine synthase [Plasmopara halstedii]CEG46585.1 pseudouridine synthase [Plasmopara halstedii]|eukprot:XP_024582954.1 pseudouridine synthase [Plasmopara halstedii]